MVRTPVATPLRKHPDTAAKATGRQQGGDRLTDCGWRMEMRGRQTFKGKPNYIDTMAYKISEDCVACGTCKGECPQDAIVEGDIYSINPDICVDCGTCADVCPMGAISPAE